MEDIAEPDYLLLDMKEDVLMTVKEVIPPQSKHNVTRLVLASGSLVDFGGI